MMNGTCQSKADFIAINKHKFIFLQLVLLAVVLQNRENQENFNTVQSPL